MAGRPGGDRGAALGLAGAGGGGLARAHASAPVCSHTGVVHSPGTAAPGAASDESQERRGVPGTSTGPQTVLPASAGILVRGDQTSDNVIQGNLIGSDPAGSAVLGDQQYGVYLQNINNTPDIGFQLGLAWVPLSSGLAQKNR